MAKGELMEEREHLGSAYSYEGAFRNSDSLPRNEKKGPKPVMVWALVVSLRHLNLGGWG